MASIVSQIEVLVHRVLSDRSGNWPHVIGRNHPQKPVMVTEESEKRPKDDVSILMCITNPQTATA